VQGHSQRTDAGQEAEEIGSILPLLHLSMDSDRQLTSGEEVNSEPGEPIDQDKEAGRVHPTILRHGGEGSFQEADNEGDGGLLRAGQLYHHDRSIQERDSVYHTATDLHEQQHEAADVIW
jgi:hypothetical protein